ncbi:MAG: amidohydrolase family protein [Pseudomonadales bacterium]
MTMLQSVLAWSLVLWPGLVLAAQYDTVLLGGRVMDPESGLDAVRNVGIRDGRIATISRRALKGREVIDASGHVVTAGFIDAHFHWVRPVGYKLGLRDGVTTAMDLEFGALGTQVEQWYEQRAGQTQVNYGTSASHELARSKVLDDAQALDAPTAGATRTAGSGWSETVADVDQGRRILAVLDAGLRAGAVGVGSTLGYMPGVTAQEMYAVQAQAAGYGRQTSVHLRHTPGTATSEVNGAQEVMANAVALGAPLSINHFNNPGWRQVQTLLLGLRAAGHNIWGEIYPYAAGSTTINAVFLRPESWVEALGRRYEDTMFDPQTQTFYTRERYEQTVAEAPATVVVLYKMPADLVPDWLRLPGITMGSDGMPIPGDWPWPTAYSALPNMHPRGAGARGKSLRMAREHDIPLMQVLAALSYNVARYLGDTGLVALQERGRMQEGKVADIVIFDPDTVTDKATYAQGTRPTEGIPWVLVNGVVTVRDGAVLADVAAGQPIRFAPLANP